MEAASHTGGPLLPGNDSSWNDLDAERCLGDFFPGDRVGGIGLLGNWSSPHLLACLLPGVLRERPMAESEQAGGIVRGTQTHRIRAASGDVFQLRPLFSVLPCGA